MDKTILSTKNTASPDWRELISRLIKSEMSKRNFKYSDLNKLLEAQGTAQSVGNLRNKINRGIMGADLFIQLLLVMNVTQIDRDTILDILNNINN